MKVTEQSISCHLANGFFNKRQNIVVPNVSWGLYLPYECDMIVITKYQWLYEVEIKISIADLKNDKKKQKWNKFYNEDSLIKSKGIWFAMPKSIYEKGKDYIPEQAGIISIDINSQFWNNQIIRKPKFNNDAKKASQEIINKLCHLGIMRYWNLLEKTLWQKKN